MFGFKRKLDWVNVIPQPKFGLNEELDLKPFKSNMEAMTKHVDLISTTTPTAKHSVVIMDQANWHQTHLANHFKNITIIHIPP
ncbi:hypothetical protein CWN99_20550 [Vibrio splendidus]|nr:hypothetical protein CWN99_20550 [Vibrio splendidus]